jgi:metal-responsive CopG/Arc/MetJ family transcriptional regulator
MAAETIKLPANLDRQLTELAKERRSTRAKVLRDALQALAKKKPAKARTKKLNGTIGELAADLIGSVEGPGDLNSNPKYMTGYGR